MRSVVDSSYAAGSTVKTVLSRCLIVGGKAFGLDVEGGSEIVLDNSTLTNNRYASIAVPEWGTSASIIYSRGNNTIYNNGIGSHLTPLASQ